MNLTQQLQTLLHDAAGMEALYQDARNHNRQDAFTEALEAQYELAPENLLLAAWHHRLSRAEGLRIPTVRAGIHWRFVLPFGALLTLFFFLVTGIDETFLKGAIAWLPILIFTVEALVLCAYLVLAGRQPWRWPLAVTLTLCLLAGWAMVFSVASLRAQTGELGFLSVHEQYYQLAIIHSLGAAALAVIWVAVRNRGANETRHAVFLRAVEVGITAGLFSSAGGFAFMIGYGLFGALGIRFQEEIIMRAGMSVAYGFIPLLAMAATYEPTLSPEQQDFNRGFSRVVAFILRLLLPVALVGLVVYLAVIPFFFWAPFNDREVLIIYNVFLFAVIGTVVGASPLSLEQLKPGQRVWLRNGLLSIAVLTIIISLYALAAVTYRTAQSYFTANRVTVIGWNIINISLLVLMGVRMLRSWRTDWAAAVNRTIHHGLVVYSAWVVMLLILLPLLFR